MSQLMHTQMKTLIRPLPKYSPSLIPGQPAPHTEIVLYEDVDAEKSEEHMVFSQWVQTHVFAVSKNTRV